MVKLEFYIPQIIGKRDVVRQFAKQMATTFGGCTILTDCLGLWKDKEDVIVNDDIAIVRVIASDWVAGTKKDYVESLLKDIADKLEQETILWTSEPQVTTHFVDGTPTKALSETSGA